MSNGHLDELDYSYYDYDRFEQFRNVSSSSHIPSWHSLARIVLVILLRVGFVLVHVGSVPVNDVNLILLQNIVDVCWVTITFVLIGFIIAYNGDVNGLTGEGYWIGDATVDKDEAIIGWSAVVIAAAICTSGIVGRTHIVGYLATGFLLAAFAQPFLIHWMWTPKGWMKRNLLNGRNVQFRDYAGSAVVHLVGGLSGFIGYTILGRRILQLSAIDDASIAAGTSGTVFAGQLMVFIGLQSLGMPIERFVSRSKTRYNIYLNNLLAASSCGLLVVTFHFVFTDEVFNHWTVMRCVQATIAGLVIVSAGTDIYSPLAAIGLGSIASVIFYLVSRLLFHSALEDYCNIVAIHLACALFGSILVPLFDTDDNADTELILLNFSWQLICIITTLFFVAITMCAAFLALQSLGLLRNRTEHLNHLRASIIMETSPPRSFWRRLFHTDDEPVYLQPGSTSDSGQRPKTSSHVIKYQNEGAAVEKGRVIETDATEI
ncbi:uncharacterized protein LOC128877413 [Hylaeus volcanicus]|uniref:uncharacterized protein LOC128877413 n=1 Tax=Hylaeus volcanicus TaxID=313075 RepID=UPI0023B82F08|nr:uncharacterized protein LOC128877413 [Hylaeus volcanicus]